MGCYYLTMGRKEGPKEKGDGMVFSSFRKLHTAYSMGKVGIHARIKCPCDREAEGPLHAGRLRQEEGLRQAGRDHRRPRDVQRHPAEGDAVLQHRDAVKKRTGARVIATAIKCSAVVRRSTCSTT
jgi:hypothetical protein